MLILQQLAADHIHRAQHARRARAALRMFAHLHLAQRECGVLRLHIACRPPHQRQRRRIPHRFQQPQTHDQPFAVAARPHSRALPASRRASASLDQKRVARTARQGRRQPQARTGPCCVDARTGATLCAQWWPTCAECGPSKDRACACLGECRGRRRPQLQQAQQRRHEQWQQACGQDAVIAGFAMRRCIMGAGVRHVHYGAGVRVRSQTGRRGSMTGMQRALCRQCRSTYAHRLDRLRLAPAADQRSDQHQHHRQTGKQGQQPVATGQTQHASKCKPPRRPAAMVAADARPHVAPGCPGQPRMTRAQACAGAGAPEPDGPAASAPGPFTACRPRPRTAVLVGSHTFVPPL